MKTIIGILLLALTAIVIGEELPNFEGDYTFAATGAEIGLDTGTAVIKKNDAGETILSLQYANRTWEAPFILHEYEPGPGNARRNGIPPYFDIVFVARDGDFAQTLILSGEYINGNLSGQLMSHRGISNRFEGEVFRVGKFQLKQVHELKAERLAPIREKNDDLTPNHPVIIISILNDGRISIEDLELQDEELLTKLEPILREFPNCPIRIRAEGEVSYKDVLKVIDICQKAGTWNLSFSTNQIDQK